MMHPAISRDVTLVIQSYENEQPSRETEAAIVQSVKELINKNLNPQDKVRLRGFLDQRVKTIEESNLSPTVKETMIKVINQVERYMPGELRSQAKIYEANLQFTRGFQLLKKKDWKEAFQCFEAAAFLNHPGALLKCGRHHLDESKILEMKIIQAKKSDGNVEALRQKQKQELALAQKQLKAAAAAGIDEAKALLIKNFGS